IAKPMILVLIGEKWADTIPILQVLSIMISVMSLIYLNNSMLKLLGKVNLLLWSSLLKNAVTIALLFLTMKYGIIVLCLSYVIVNTLVFFLYAFISGRLTGYRLNDQIKDIIPFFVCSIVMGIGMYIPLDFISLSLIGIFGSQIIIGLLIIISLYYFLFKK